MRVTRGTCDILNYSRKGKAGRNNCSCDILKGKEEECAKLHNCTAPLRAATTASTHPLIQKLVANKGYSE